jgi:ACR3 family arsenite transporter
MVPLNVFMERLAPITPIGLIVALVFAVRFPRRRLANPFFIVHCFLPLILQTVLIFFHQHGWAKAWKLPLRCGTTGMIDASNFFELAVAVTIGLFGCSRAALAAVVGVLVEVPVMLALVRLPTPPAVFSGETGLPVRA